MCPQPDSHPEPAFYLTLPQGEIAVYAYGQGDKVMIALHGFDDHGISFQEWESTLGSVYTIYAPDLPFHGQSKWGKKQLDQADVRAIVKGILKEVQARSYMLVGHSFGARLILCTTPSLKHKPEQLVLLAPGGIGDYDRVIPIWLQRGLELSLKWPGWFRTVVNLGSTIGLVSKFHKRYAEAQIYPPKQRYRLFRLFNSSRNFPTSTERIKKFLHDTPIGCLVVVAQKDRLVSSEKIKSFFAPMPNVKVMEVIGSHDMVNERIAMLVNESIE